LITHVVFDFDGTLVDSKDVLIGMYNRMAEKRRYGKLTAENIGELSDLSIAERCRRLGVPLYMLPWLAFLVVRAYREAVGTIEFIGGMPELLAELKQRGHQLMILSSNGEGNIRAFLKRHGMEDQVAAVFGGSSIFGKARKMRALMKQARLRPEQLVYVGDEHRDIEACKEVGVRVIAVRWGTDSESRLRDASPDFIAERPADVAGCVARWSAG
jgi:phosphoglycolate phosphatase